MNKSSSTNEDIIKTIKDTSNKEIALDSANQTIHILTQKIALLTEENSKIKSQLKELNEEKITLSNDLDIYKSSNELRGINSDGKNKYIKSLQGKISELTELNKRLTINTDKLIQLNKKYEERIEKFKTAIMNHELLSNFKTEYELSKKLLYNYEKPEIKDKINKQLISINKQEEFTTSIKNFIDSLSNKIIEIKEHNDFGDNYLNKIKDNKDLINRLVEHLNEDYLDKTKKEEVDSLEIIIKLLLESNNPDKTFEFLEEDSKKRGDLESKLQEAGLTDLEDKTSEELEELSERNKSEFEKLREESHKIDLTAKQREELDKITGLNVKEYKSKLDEFKSINEKELKDSQNIENLLKICDNKYKIAKEILFFYNDKEGLEILLDNEDIKKIVDKYSTIINSESHPLIVNRKNEGKIDIINIKISNNNSPSDFLTDIFKNKTIKNFRNFEENFGNLLFEFGKEYDINKNTSIKNSVEFLSDNISNISEIGYIPNGLNYNFIDSKYLDFIKDGYPNHEKFKFTIEYPDKSSEDYQLFSSDDYDKILSKIDKTQAINIEKIYYSDETIKSLNQSEIIFSKEWKDYLKKIINGETSKITKIILNKSETNESLEAFQLSAEIQNIEQSMESTIIPEQENIKKTYELKSKLPTLDSSIINKLMLKGDKLIEKFKEEDKKFFRGNCDTLRLYKKTSCLLGKCIDYQRIETDGTNSEIKDRQKCIRSNIRFNEFVELLNSYYLKIKETLPETENDIQNKVYIARYSSLQNLFHNLLEELINKFKTELDEYKLKDIPTYEKIQENLNIYDCLFDLDCEDSPKSAEILDSKYGSIGENQYKELPFMVGNSGYWDKFKEIRELKDKLLEKNEEIVKSIPDFETKLLQGSTEDYLTEKQKLKEQTSHIEKQIKELNKEKEIVKKEIYKKKKDLIKRSLALKIKPITDKLFIEKFKPEILEIAKLSFKLTQKTGEILELELEQSSPISVGIKSRMKKIEGNLESNSKLLDENEKLRQKIKELEGKECDKSGGGKTIKRRKVRNKRTKRKV